MARSFGYLKLVVDLIEGRLRVLKMPGLIQFSCNIGRLDGCIVNQRGKWPATVSWTLCFVYWYIQKHVLSFNFSSCNKRRWISKGFDYVDGEYSKTTAISQLKVVSVKGGSDNGCTFLAGDRENFPPDSAFSFSSSTSSL